MNVSARLIAITTLMCAVSGCYAGADAADDYALEGEGLDGAEVAGELGTAQQAVLVASPFDTATDMFKFGNKFKNQVGIADVTTNGLCGGMSYAALDYYYANKTTPLVNYAPAEGTAFRDYLYARQVDSLSSNSDKWGELTLNPFGSRTAEFWNWGIQKTGRVAEIRASIDAGKPAPIGLFGDCDGCRYHHQALVVGYDLGTYSPANGGGYPDLKLYVADPNFPGKRMTLRPDRANYRYYYHEEPTYKWLTYFWDSKYTRKAVPLFPIVKRGILVTFRTGANDLGGNGNNVNVVLTMRNGTSYSYTNLNNSHRWIQYSDNSVAVELPKAADGSTQDPLDVTKLKVEIDGTDTWVVDKFWVQSIFNVAGAGTRYSTERDGVQYPTTFSPARRSVTVSL